MPAYLARIDRKILTLLGVLTASLAMLSMLWLPQFDLRAFTARQLQLRLHQANDEDVPALLARIAELDEPGLPRITVALGDDRPAVALAARDLLNRRLEQWRLLPRSESTPRIAQVAKTLAAVAPSLGADRRSHAAQLAERLLAWPVERGAANIGQLIADCERVMELDVVGDQPARMNLAQSRPATRAARDTGQAATPFLDPDKLPPAPAELPSDPATSASAMKPNKNAITEDALAADGSRRFDSLPDAETGNSTGNSTDSLLAPTEATPSEDGLTNPIASSDANKNPPASPAEIGSVRRLPDVELMQLLHHSTPGLAVAAIAELQRRGFQARHLRLARRLTDRDPVVRRVLATDLPTLSNVDPRPWLSALARDSDDSVRQAASRALSRLQPESYRDRLRKMKSKQEARTARRL